MIVEVRPRRTEKWHGKEKDEDFTRPISIVPAPDPATMQYQVELSADEWKYLKSTSYDLSLEYKQDVVHPTWDTALGRVKLENNTMFFDTSVPTDLIKIGVMRASKSRVAPSKEAAETEYPSATHYIHEEDVVLKDKVSKIAIKQEANSLLYTMPPDEIATIVFLSTGEQTAGKNFDLIRAKADDIVEKNPAEFLRWAKMEKEDVSLLSLVETAIESDLLTKDGARIMFNGDTVGFSTLEVAEYLKKKENQPLLLKLKGATKQTKK